MIRRALILAVLMPFVVSCGATLADPTGKKNSLESTQRRYTELIRWGDLERAVRFVDPELQGEFMRQASSFNKIRISDFEIVEIGWDATFHPGADVEPGPEQIQPEDPEDEREHVIVTVNYSGFSEVTFLQTEFKERQEWYNNGGPLGNSWRVRPEFIRLVDSINGITQ